MAKSQHAIRSDNKITDKYLNQQFCVIWPQPWKKWVKRKNCLVIFDRKKLLLRQRNLHCKFIQSFHFLTFVIFRQREIASLPKKLALQVYSEFSLFNICHSLTQCIVTYKPWVETEWGLKLIFIKRELSALAWKHVDTNHLYGGATNASSPNAQDAK